MSRSRRSATKISFSTPVSVNGTPVEAGGYELFTVPTEKEWTAIIDVKTTAVPKAEAALQAEGRKPYFAAAMFSFETELDLNRAAELIALARESQRGHIGMLHRQALILVKKVDSAGAIAAVEKSLAGAHSAGPEIKDEYTRLDTALFEKLRR